MVSCSFMLQVFPVRLYRREASAKHMADREWHKLLECPRFYIASNISLISPTLCDGGKYDINFWYLSGCHILSLSFRLSHAKSHVSLITLHASRLTRHAVTRHVSHNTRHASRNTRHASRFHFFGVSQVSCDDDGTVICVDLTKAGGKCVSKHTPHDNICASVQWVTS